jgi:hypothetical protein
VAQQRHRAHDDLGDERERALAAHHEVGEDVDGAVWSRNELSP